MDKLSANELSLLEAFDVRGVSRRRLLNFTAIMYAFKGFARNVTPEEIQTTLTKLVKQEYLLEVKVANQNQWRLTDKAVTLLDQAATTGISQQSDLTQIEDWLAKADVLMEDQKFQEALVYLGKAMDSSDPQSDYLYKIQAKIQDCIKQL